MTAQELLGARPRARLAPLRARCRARTTPLVVESASGVRLRLAEPVAGHDELVDGMSSWWSAIHGYRHPALDAAAHDQLEPDEPRDVRRAHPRARRRAWPRGWWRSPRSRCSTCSSPTPARCPSRSRSRCASSTGARAGRPGERRLLTWRGGYHGDTFSPMSVCDPEGGMHHAVARACCRGRCSPTRRPPASTRPPTRLRRPPARRWSTAHADELAAIIVEPVVQGAGGMRFHCPAYLRVLRELCDAHDVLLVFDEIATGFGRTGRAVRRRARRASPRT